MTTSTSDIADIVVPAGPDLKPQHEDTGLGGSIAAEGQVKHSMRGVMFILALAACGVLFTIFAVFTARS